MNLVIIVIGSIAAIMDRCGGREEQYGIWCNSIFRSIGIKPCILFDQQKKIIIKPSGMENVAGLFVVGIMSAVKYFYHGPPSCQYPIYFGIRIVKNTKKLKMSVDYIIGHCLWGINPL